MTNISYYNYHNCPMSPFIPAEIVPALSHGPLPNYQPKFYGPQTSLKQRQHHLRGHPAALTGSSGCFSLVLVSTGRLLYVHWGRAQ